MTTALTLLSLAVAAYRIRKGLFTRVEWLLLALWLGHFALEEAQLLVKFHHFRYDPRYFRPASFLSWIYLCWGVAAVWHRRWLRRLALALVAAAGVYDLVMVFKPVLPFGRRSAYVRACDWAVDRIREDWSGPVRDPERVFSLSEYHTPYRPVVFAHVARVPYLLGGRQALLTDFGAEDLPDYWVIDSRRDDPPPPGSGFELLDAFRTGRFEFELYRRR